MNQHQSPWLQVTLNPNKNSSPSPKQNLCAYAQEVLAGYRHQLYHKHCQQHIDATLQLLLGQAQEGAPLRLRCIPLTEVHLTFQHSPNTGLMDTLLHELRLHAQLNDFQLEQPVHQSGSMLFQSLLSRIECFLEGEEEGRLVIFISAEVQNEYGEVAESLVASVVDYLQDRWGDHTQFNRQVYLINAEVMALEQEQGTTYPQNALLHNVLRMPFTEDQVLKQELIQQIFFDDKLPFMLAPDLLAMLLQPRHYRLTFPRVYALLRNCFSLKILSLSEQEVLTLTEIIEKQKNKDSSQEQMSWQTEQNKRKMQVGLNAFRELFHLLAYPKYIIEQNEPDLATLHQLLPRDSSKARQAAIQVLNLLFRKEKFEKQVMPLLKYFNISKNGNKLVKVIEQLFLKIQYDFKQTELLTEEEEQRLMGVLDIKQGRPQNISDNLAHLLREIFQRTVQQPYQRLLDMPGLSLDQSLLETHLNPDLTALGHHVLCHHSEGTLMECRQWLYHYLDRHQVTPSSLLCASFQQVYPDLPGGVVSYWLDYFLLKGYLVEGKHTNTLQKTFYLKERQKHQAHVLYY